MDNTISKSWYTKYRPRTINNYSGERIKSTVQKRFTKIENMPHVVFVHGDRGCGKTTICRMLTKYYLCTNLTENGPCEECEMCRSINEILIDGNSTEVECPGVTELDATIMRGVDEIQNVLDDALQAPIYSEFKVLIIDECHMISNAGQNSMLKIIEDIPSHLIVMFATTDPQKVLQTIKSRCQLTLEVQRQTIEDMVNRLEYIAMQEKLEVSREALEVIVKKANRVPRECINKLEEVAKTYGGQVTIDNVREYLGGVASEVYLNYFKSSQAGLSSIVKFIKDLSRKNIKIADFVNGLLGFVMDCLYIKHGVAIDEYPPDYVGEIKGIFKEYNTSEMDLILQIIEHMVNTIDPTNQNKSEIILTTTAMRISKVDLLTKGLAEEEKEAIVENKKSLIEYSKKLKSDPNLMVEQSKMDISLDTLNDVYTDIRTVTDTQNLLDSINLPSLDVSEEEKEIEDATVDVDDMIAGFLEM